MILEIEDVTLEFGQKIADGPPDVVLRDPRVAEPYLGRAFQGKGVT